MVSLLIKSIRLADGVVVESARSETLLIKVGIVSTRLRRFPDEVGIVNDIVDVLRDESDNPVNALTALGTLMETPGMSVTILVALPLEAVTTKDELAVGVTRTKPNWLEKVMSWLQLETVCRLARPDRTVAQTMVMVGLYMVVHVPVPVPIEGV